MLDDIVDVLSHLLLIGYSLSDRVCCCRVNFLSQVEEEIEVSVFEAALLYVLVFAHIFLQILLGGLVTHHCWEVTFLDNGEFVVFGRTKGDFD